MTAAEHLSPHQFPGYQPAIGKGEQLPMFMTPHEIGNMMSADYGGHVRDVPERMRSRYAHEKQQDELRGHTPGQSTLDLREAEIKEHGGIHTPVKVVHLASGIAALYDGHHRSVVAMENNHLVPVTHYFDHKTAMVDVRRDR
jgi:hypothetical protein